MAARRSPGRSRPLTPLEQELSRQSAEGLARAYLESHEELALHEGARAELHHLKAQAVATLERSMQNTGVCPKCRFSGLVVDKSAVQAAMGILDRTGLPPAREIRHEDKRQVVEESEIVSRAVAALVSIEPEQLGHIVRLILGERPDARPYIESALTGPLLIEAGA